MLNSKRENNATALKLNLQTDSANIPHNSAKLA